MSKFIGIKQLWYTNPLATAPTQAGMATLVSSATEIKNVHQDTWGYSQDDPSVTDYINELTGKPYYRDAEQAGNKTINFTMGEYDYATKIALQGGTAVTGGWSAPATPALINKCIIALTKTNTYIVFTNASIIAKGDQQQKAVGLGVTAVAMENSASGVADEYWFDKP
jgi:hypothetical protein